jgi:membrane protease YdiL (CAAX protease family)
MTYWAQSRLPWPSLVFLFPLLLTYELVVWHAGPAAETVRNGADSWMRSGLASLGFGASLLLPGLLVAGLVIWHLSREHPWSVSWDTLAGMFAESLLYAFALIVAGQMQDLLFHEWSTATHLRVFAIPSGAAVPSTAAAAATATDAVGPASRLVTYVGAGIYEETLFRLCLLPACYGVLRTTRLEKKAAAVLAIVVTSLVFSLAHYVGGGGEAATWFAFTFRALAGAFFAVLFVFRGFGITVGCHAAYDILVGVIWELRA